jgi:RHS repeat-associated protein
LKHKTEKPQIFSYGFYHFIRFRLWKAYARSQIGRWHVWDLKADLLELSSLYVYCYNNPIAYKDPDGEQAVLISGRTARP